MGGLIGTATLTKDGLLSKKRVRSKAATKFKVCSISGLQHVSFLVQSNNPWSPWFSAVVEMRCSENNLSVNKYFLNGSNSYYSYLKVYYIKEGNVYSLYIEAQAITLTFELIGCYSDNRSLIIHGDEIEEIPSDAILVSD